MTEQLKTLEQVRVFAQVSEPTILAEIKLKKLIGYRVGRQYRFTDQQIDEWLKRRRTA